MERLKERLAVARAWQKSECGGEDQAREVLRTAQDRNLTVHTYDETLAEEICSRLSEHARLMEAWLDAIEQRL